MSIYKTEPEAQLESVTDLPDYGWSDDEEFGLFDCGDAA